MVAHAPKDRKYEAFDFIVIDPLTVLPPNHRQQQTLAKMASVVWKARVEPAISGLVKLPYTEPQR